MTDFRLVATNRDDVILTWDWVQLQSGLLDETQELASAVLVALGTDGLADANDVLPDPRSTDRRGWWGNLNASTIWNGWPLGWKGWLLSRAKIVDSGAKEGATVNRVRMYLAAALQPFVDNRVCSKFTIDSIIVDDLVRRITATFTMYRGPKSAIQLQYQPLWTEIFPGS
jgi:phage gp46-like protein